MPKTRNTSPEFVGLEQLKQQHARQLAEFERWAAHGDWQAFHAAHFDWWMFPIDETSRLGSAYTVYAEDVAALKGDPAFLERYLRGVELLMLAWGWDLRAQRAVATPQPGQQWSRWPIRLYKAGRSLQLFGFHELFASLAAFTQALLQRGESMRYGSKDLSLLFTEGRPRRSS